ncbi:multidrug ABC transporter permease ATP-binding protein [Lacticaseibacillus brantae DSM 23927]|uniref:Multidrug ABC transporter permease ATP-binding protein n=2 Tax=Lacticaseibacillus brantae TaxID=943673 RepID=A0A0R2B7I8_9LACO|nr:multidrug ABC transporter permease ATP-binding protein [Lacticaseibacillus brantae DSM 23927]
MPKNNQEDFIMLTLIKRLPILQTFIAILFLLLQSATGLYLPYLTATIINQGIAKGNTQVIWVQGALMIGVAIIGLIGSTLNSWLFTKIAYELGGDIRSDLYRKILSFSKAEFDHFGSASLITRDTDDVTQVQNLVQMGLQFLLMAPIQLVGGIIMTWVLEPRFGLVFLAAVPFLVIVYLLIFNRVTPLYAKIQTLMDKLNLAFKEGLTGVKVIRAFNKESAEYDKYESLNQAYSKTSVTAGTIMGFFIPALSLLLNFASLLIVWMGAQFVADGSLQIGSIVGAISYATQILTGFASISFIIMMVPKGQISAQRVNEVLNQPLSISEPTATAPAETTKGLTFDHVDFRYLGAQKRALADISFSVKAGETFAIIGSTGDGKSSLVNLISRLYDAESGQVELNGVDVKQIPQEQLHAKISYVPQTAMLFFGTIRSNMLVGKPEATDDEIWQALEMAQAKDFVAALPDGLDSQVAKAGDNFSGGQKQRLCIARALLKDADVYIFDDSFSALDFKTDAAVRQSMRAKTGNAVTIIVAQRVASITTSDQIAVLDQGSIVGLGTHAELAKTNPVYQQIMQSQSYQEEDSSDAKY